jgi:hypothetical protein
MMYSVVEMQVFLRMTPALNGLKEVPESIKSLRKAAFELKASVISLVDIDSARRLVTA